MKVYRSMSAREFNLMISGKTIVGKEHFDGVFGSKTTSRGVCFFPEFFGDNTPGWEIAWSAHNQDGIGGDVLVEFETKQSLTPSTGIYSMPQDWTGGPSNRCIRVNEFCCPSYNHCNMIPLRFARLNPAEWNWGHVNPVWQSPDCQVPELFLLQEEWDIDWEAPPEDEDDEDDDDWAWI